MDQCCVRFPGGPHEDARRGAGTVRSVNLVGDEIMPASLPQLERLVLTDGGLETDLIFNRGIDLPHFASIVLLRSREGRAALKAYYRSYLELARRLGTGFVLESPTWRASPDWAEPLGLDQGELDGLN